MHNIVNQLGGIASTQELLVLHVKRTTKSRCLAAVSSCACVHLRTINERMVPERADHRTANESDTTAESYAPTEIAYRQLGIAAQLSQKKLSCLF